MCKGPARGRRGKWIREEQGRSQGARHRGSEGWEIEGDDSGQVSRGYRVWDFITSIEGFAGRS